METGRHEKATHKPGKRSDVHPNAKAVHSVRPLDVKAQGGDGHRVYTIRATPSLRPGKEWCTLMKPLGMNTPTSFHRVHVVQIPVATAGHPRYREDIQSLKLDPGLVEVDPQCAARRKSSHHTHNVNLLSVDSEGHSVGHWERRG